MWFSVGISEQRTQKEERHVPTRCCGTELKTAKYFFLLLPHPSGKTIAILTLEEEAGEEV